MNAASVSVVPCSAQNGLGIRCDGMACDGVLKEWQGERARKKKGTAVVRYILATTTNVLRQSGIVTRPRMQPG